jgi:Mrp family chromosome partitioning ATPase
VVDGVVLVARAGVSTDTAAKRLQRTFARIGDITLLGVVVNDVADELANYGYGYGGAAEPAAWPASGEETPAASAQPTGR